MFSLVKNIVKYLFNQKNFVMISDFFDKYIGKPAFFILIALVISHFFYSPEPESKPPIHENTPTKPTVQPDLNLPDYIPIQSEWLLPLDTGDRTDWSTLLFEHDANFKDYRKTWNPRKPRRHTGVDLQNGGDWGRLGGPGEAVYAMGPGRVFGIYGKPPNRRVIIAHQLPSGKKFWSCYLHVEAIRVRPGQRVDAWTVIARRLNSRELRKYGRDYNHLHFEILRRLPPWRNHKYRWMSQYCYSTKQVDRYFHNPETFLKQLWEIPAFTD